MIIRVTGEHIAMGEQHSCGSCPIALAIKDHGQGISDVAVGNKILQWHNGNHFHTCNLPPVAQRFIQAFDCGYVVGPFEFEVRA